MSYPNSSRLILAVLRALYSVPDILGRPTLAFFCFCSLNSRLLNDEGSYSVFC